MTKKATAHTILNTRIDRKLIERAKSEAKDRRIPVRAIVEAALRERYDPAHREKEVLLLYKEIRGLRTDVRRVDFGNRVILEASTQISRNMFSCLPAPTPQSRLAGEGFYNALTASLERVFLEDRALLDRLFQSWSTSMAASEFDELGRDTNNNETETHDH